MTWQGTLSRSVMKREFRSISLLTGASTIQVAALALLSFALAKVLPIEDFAITRLVTAYFLILTMLGHFCLHDAVSAFAAAEPNVEQRKSYISTGAALVSAVSLVIALIAAVVFQRSAYWQGDLARALTTIALFLPAMTLAILFGAILRAVGDLNDLNRYVIAVGLIPFLIIMPASALWGIDGWIASRVVTLVAVLAVAAYLVRALIQIANPRLQHARQLLSFARVQFGSGVLSMAMQSADVLLLDRLGSGLKVVGIYALAALFTKSVMILPESIGRIYFRKISAPQDDTGQGKSVTRLLVTTVAASVLLAIFVAALVPTLIRTVFGADYDASVEVLYVLCLGILPSGIWIALSTINIARKRPLHALYISAVGVITCIMALVVLVPDLGAVGAAWAMNAANTAGATVGLTLLLASRHKGPTP